MKKSSVGKFLLGAGIGAGLAMLFTKNTGKENREILKNKANELIQKAKSIDSKELKTNIEKKVNEIMSELSDLDKEKALNLAKKKADQIKAKSEELVEYLIEKGTPVLEKSANALREKAIIVTKDVLKKLEAEEK